MRTGLVLVTLAAFLCSWLATRVAGHQRDVRTLNELKHLNPAVEWSDPKPQVARMIFDRCSWLRDAADYFRRARVLFLSGATDADVARLSELSEVESLFIEVSPGVTDVGIAKLSQLKHLSALMLEQARVSETGIESLRSLSDLSYLYLSDVSVTRQLLRSTSRLSSLRTLRLDCDIPEEAVATLEDIRQIQKLDLHAARCGEDHDESIRRIKKARPNLEIFPER